MPCRAAWSQAETLVTIWEEALVQKAVVARHRGEKTFCGHNKADVHKESLLGHRAVPGIVAILLDFTYQENLILWYEKSVLHGSWDQIPLEQKPGHLSL